MQCNHYSALYELDPTRDSGGCISPKESTVQALGHCRGPRLDNAKIASRLGMLGILYLLKIFFKLYPLLISLNISENIVISTYI